MSTCRRCGDPIRWDLTTGGKRIPLDAEPNPEGNVLITDRRAVVLSGAKLERARRDGERLWMPHFATCERDR